MKKLYSLVIVMGFVIMLGTAGSVDVAGMSVLKAVLLEVLGMMIVLFGTSALMHYNRYSRKMLLNLANCVKNDNQQVGNLISLIYKNDAESQKTIDNSPR